MHIATFCRYPVICVLIVGCFCLNPIRASEEGQIGSLLLNWQPDREIPVIPIPQMLQQADIAISSCDPADRKRMSELHYIKSQLLRHSGDKSLALSVLQDSLRLNPENIPARYLSLYQKVSQNKGDDRTLSDCREFAAQHPGRSEPLLLLGTDSYIKKNYDDALGYLQGAAKIDPDCPRTHLLIASVYAAKWDVDNAVKEADKVLTCGFSLEDDHWNAHAVKGECYIKRGMADRAIPHLTTYWSHDGSNQSANMLLLFGLIQTRRCAEAEKVIAEMRLREHDDWTVDCDHAILLAQGGDLEGAIRLLNDVLQVDLNRAKALLFLGRIHQSKNEWIAAFECFEKASAADSLVAPDAAIRAKLLLAAWPSDIERPSTSVDLDAVLRKSRGMFVTADGKLAQAICDAWLGKKSAGLFELRRLSGDKSAPASVRESSRHLLSLSQSQLRYDISHPADGITWTPPLLEAMIGPY